MITKTILTAVAISAMASGAFAKGHAQGTTDVPGASVGTETVAAAHTLGSAKGNRPADKGPTKSNAVGKAGR